MDNLIRFARAARSAPDLHSGALRDEAAACGVPPRSVRVLDGAVYFIFRDGGGRRLAVYGKPEALSPFEGTAYPGPDGEALGSCPRSLTNCRALRGLFPFLNPVSRKGRRFTLGLGDRLGIAGGGHLRALSGLDVFPVLAQQSVRELTLTGRTYDDVLSAAVWAVFEEGYEGGFGADGDHLKNAFEIEYAIGCGYSMITLDCSEHIDAAAATAGGEALARGYGALSQARREELARRYLGRSFPLEGGAQVVFGPEELMRSALVYGKAIDFACGIHERFIAPGGLDFEISVDETPVPTTPENHFFVASELSVRGVRAETLAPRFCGEFQKGIDYIGDARRFEAEYAVHEAIARRFGYRLSIHSGSDKFTVFPIIGALSKNGYHVKTAGTNWLEALRVLAKTEPRLMRRVYAFAVENLDAAKAYYHINPTARTAPDISGWDDSQLPRLLDADATRQILHIAYGLVLGARRDGESVFRTQIYGALDRHEEEYARALSAHIGRHLRGLGIRAQNTTPEEGRL